MNAKPTPQSAPDLRDILARLDAALADLESLGQNVSCLHLSMTVDLVRIEVNSLQNG